MRILRASEIGLYLYCRRAWWYRRQGHEPENLAEMSSGQELHQRHGMAVLVSGCLQWLAVAALLAAFVLLVAYLAWQLVQPSPL